MEVYGWQEGALVTLGSAGLSNGAVTLNRIQSNYLGGEFYIPALYVTSTLTDGGRAVDVLAFQGEIPGECKFCGYWKVYFHEEEARRLFSLFDRCREAYAEAFLSGKTVSQLLELPLPVAA